MRPALFDEFPDLVERLKHRKLGQFPTAIERLELGRLGPSSRAEVWVKREDRAGLVYGGNKVRKLEFLLAGETPQRIITFGAFGSSHILAAGIYGRACGSTVEAVVVPQPMTARVAKVLAADLGSGVRLWPCRSYLGIPRALWRAWRQGARPRLIPPGGSDSVGTLGWWSGGLEIAAQVAAGVAPRFDAIYLALGSGGTSAGLLLGLGSSVQTIHAVRVVPWPMVTERRIRGIARSCHAYLSKLRGQPISRSTEPKLRVEHRFFGAGYGAASIEGDRAMERAAALGLSLDATYTAKSFAALLSDVESGKLDGKRVLFLNTYNSADTSSFVSAGDLTTLPDWLRTAIADSRRDVR